MTLSPHLTALRSSTPAFWSDGDEVVHQKLQGDTSGRLSRGRGWGGSRGEQNPPSQSAPEDCRGLVGAEALPQPPAPTGLD